MMKKHPNSFWILNLLEFCNMLAYQCALLQLPIYIAQKDAPGGLHWDQAIKGLIFFWWALMQNIVPIVAGGYADRFGHRKTMLLSFAFVIIGYFMIGTQTEFLPFLMGTLLLGFGLGVFRPTLKGSVAHSLAGSDSASGWGYYFMMLNIAVMLASPLSYWLKSISWQAVFFGSGLVFSLNFILLFLLKKNDFGAPQETNESRNPFAILKSSVISFFEGRVVWLILIMSGFFMIYMQFYETMTNFLVDWTDTSVFVRYLNLPDWMTMTTTRGTMVSYEIIYMLSSAFIIVSVVGVSKLVGKLSAPKALALGILIAACGLFVSGSSPIGLIAICGVLIYTVGEMVSNTRINDFLGKMAPANKKALFMSYLNISMAIGFSVGSLLGGFLYRNISEKAYLAAYHLEKEYSIYLDSSSLNQSVEKLQTIKGLSPHEATILLWDTYHPWMIWIVFGFIGLVSIVALYFYAKRYKAED
jgi:MFS family permease